MSCRMMKLKNVCDFIDGDRGKNYPSNGELTSSGSCLFLNTGNVTKNGFYFEKCQFITAEKDALLRKGKLRHGDVVLTTRGTLGNVGFFSNKLPYQSVRINSGMLILRASVEFDSRFLFYAVQSPMFQAQINGVKTGSAQPQLPVKTLKEMEVSFPSREGQERIADVLSAYDELIENNRRQIKLLEEAAQRLYKEWFIDLGFPGHETTPIIDGLPEGWRRAKLVDVADVQYGFAFKASQFNSDGNGLPIIRIRNVVDGFSRDYTTEKADEKYLVYDGDTVVGMDGDFYINTWTGGMAYLVQRSCRIKAHDDGLDAYLRWAIVAPIRAFQNGIVGATVAHLGKRHIDSIEVLIPPYGAAGLFSDLRDQIVNLKKQIAAAREARDRLLPKLMSGEIEVQ